MRTANVEDQKIDLEDATLPQLEARFDELAGSRLTVFTAFTEARTTLENKLAEFEQIYGKIEVINTITSTLLGATPTDGSPGDNPYSTDILDYADNAMVYVGAGTTALSAFYTVYSGLRAMRTGNAATGVGVAVANVADDAADVAGLVGGAANAADDAGDVVAAVVANTADDAAGAVAAGAVRWPRLKFVGGVVGTIGGVGLAGLGVYLAARDNQERTTFYKTNIPIYEDWYTDTRSKTTQMNASTGDLEDILVELQASLGYEEGAPGRAAMIDELSSAVTQAGEFQAQFTSATKMLCNSLSVSDIVSYTGLPEALINRRRDQILADLTICQTVGS